MSGAARAPAEDRERATAPWYEAREAASENEVPEERRRALNIGRPSRVFMDGVSGRGDGELVRRARAGDADAFAVLVRRYMRAAYMVALAVAGRHEDAEDAAQDAFLVALERLEECRRPERFGAWLLAIVRNRARNVVRRESLRAADPLTWAADLPGAAAPDRAGERRELAERLLDALGALPETQREVVLLHDLEGWTHGEIAGRLGLPAGTVRSHLHFARKALRARLGAVFEDGRETGSA